MNQAQIDLHRERIPRMPAFNSQLITKSDRYQLLFVWGAIFLSFMLVQVGAASVSGIWYLFASVMVVIARPSLGLAMILGGIPIVYNVSPIGVNMSIAEVALVVVGTRALITGRAKVMPVILPILLYLFICMLSSAMEYRGKAAITSWLQMFNYFIVTMVAFSVYGRNTKAIVLAMTALVGTSCFMGISLMAQGGGGYVYAIHKNSVGATTATSLVIAVEMWFRATMANDRKRKRIWMLLMVVLAASLFFSLSRGAWGAAVIGVLILTAMRQRWQLLIRLCAVLIPLALIGYFLLPEDMQSYVSSSTDTESHSFEMRRENAAVAWEHINRNPLFGTGLGLRKQQDATNIILFTAAETGIIGLLAFLLIHVVTATTVLKFRPRIDLRDPAFSVLGLSVALLFGRLAHGMVDHYWSRGAVTAVWCMVGAMLGVAAASKTAAQRRGAH